MFGGGGEAVPLREDGSVRERRAAVEVGARVRAQRVAAAPAARESRPHRPRNGDPILRKPASFSAKAKPPNERHPFCCQSVEEISLAGLSLSFVL